MKLIGIVGKKRSGKDTTADYILEKDGFKHQLAGPIKEALSYAWARLQYDNKMTCLTEDDWEGKGDYHREKPLIINNEQARQVLAKALRYCELEWNLKSNGCDIIDVLDMITLNNIEVWTMRRFMQTLGTDLVCTHIDSMFWIKLFAIKYVDMLSSGHNYFVVPDIRQQNELDTLRAMGATIIHVVREDSDQVKDTHITEAGLLPSIGDVVIENDGTLEELYQKIEGVLCQK